LFFEPLFGVEEFLQLKIPIFKGLLFLVERLNDNDNDKAKSQGAAWLST
jgi:hypothetical protein